MLLAVCLALAIIVPLFYLAEGLDRQYRLLPITWLIASFFIFHKIILKFTGIRLGIINLVWYLIGLPVLLGIAVVVPLAILWDAAGIPPLPYALAVILFWILVALVGAKILEREAGPSSSRADEIIASIEKSGHVLHKELLGDNRYRSLFSDGRTEYTCKRDDKEVLHRDAGPALLLADGSQFYYQDGLLHGDPAVRLPDGTTLSYRKGTYQGGQFAN